MSRVSAGSRVVEGATSPLDIDQPLLLWLRAGSVKDIADGNPVSYWVDESGRGNNCSASGSARPTYVENAVGGHPALLFDGTNTVMTSGLPLKRSTDSNEMAWFVICNALDGATFGDYNGTITGSQAISGDAGPIGDSGSADIASFDQVANHRIDGVAQVDFSPLSSFHMLYADKSNVNMDYTAKYVVGQDRANTSRRWNGHIAEVLVFGSQPSAAEIAVLETYAVNKYGSFPIS